MTVRSTESQHPLSQGFHALSGEEALSRILSVQSHALAALKPVFAQIVAAADAGAQALRAGGKMAYCGAGSSGLMALADCLELPGTFGISPDRVPMLFAGGVQALLHMEGSVEDDSASALQDLDRAALSRGDVILCLAASGGTPYTLTIAKAAQARGVTVVGISNVAESALLQMADIAVLLDTGAEIVTGSTRMGAGTAQKVALNMMSVLVGIRLGHVHDGYMVNVTADNIKLLDRAARIVADLSKAPRPIAEAALEASKGAVKPAVLIARGMNAKDAQQALVESMGHLAPYLAENNH